MKQFTEEFNELKNKIKNAQHILLFAHKNPDPDSVGSVIALKIHLEGLGKFVQIGCISPFPEYMNKLFDAEFLHPDQIDLHVFDLAIGCDSVDLGFDKIIPKLNGNQTSVIFDHHPDISAKANITMIDAEYSSTCELIYNYLIKTKAIISKSIATALLAGILGDTGNFQHSCTSVHVMDAAADLMKKGAEPNKIISILFADKKIGTLKLWGRAFEKAKINKNGMIVTAITQEDIKSCDATIEDISQVATILNTVPGTKFSLILTEKENGVIKGSLRSEEYKNINVSEIAHQFGGGGHKLASGFELNGHIKETETGWIVV